jgi:P-type Cu+ transporter
MSVLLIACPCALGLATPLAIWTGLWQMSSCGLISRSSHLIDSLANTTHLFFDKTGTLTEAALSLGKVHCLPGSPWDEPSVPWICAMLETHIDHPIARAFSAASEPDRLPPSFPDNFSVIDQHWEPGHGVVANVHTNGEKLELKLGTPEWIRESASSDSAIPYRPGKTLLLAVNREPVATITLIETLRKGVNSLFGRLQKLGIRSTILTGDPSPQWSEIGNINIRSGLNPRQKAELLRLSVEKGEYPVFVGDGINDLDAMTSGFASISINDGGSSLTQSASSAILLGSSLDPILPAIDLARRIDQTLRTNLVIAATYNLIGITLAATGFLHPVVSVLIMIVSSLLVTFRAIRKAEAFSS